MVKSAGVTRRDRPSRPGTTPARPVGHRGLYAATTVAPPDTRRVDEHLAAAVLLDERRRRDLGIERARPAPRWRGSRRPTSSSGARSSIGTNTCTPLAPLVLTAPSRPTSASACRTSCATRDRHRERVALGRVEVEHEMGRVIRACRVARASGGTRSPAGSRTTAACAGRCTARTTPRASTSPPTRCTVRHPLGRVLRDVLLHERFLAAVDADHRQRPVLEHGDDAVAHGVEVVDQVALGRVGPVEQRLVEVGQRHAVA